VHVTVEFEARTYDDPDVVRMVAEVQAEYVVMYGGPDAAVVDPTEFVPPNGLFLVATLDGDPVATGGWRRLGIADDAAEPGGDTGDTGDTVAEIKRMYVAARARRRGLGRLMLAELERTAAAAGLHRLVLNTGPEQPAAIAMYLSSGYTDTKAFGHYADAPRAVFLAKSLAGTA
jgi:GNAT superfamily N-acetyltransferase